jgi:hypothetical protein
MLNDTWQLTQFVRYEVFMAVTMKKAVFWDVTPYASYKNHIT